MRSKTKPNELIESRILKACINGARGVKITHQHSPNSMEMISYLMLIDEGLIEVVTEGLNVIHRTTSKGLYLIENFERAHNDRDAMTCEV
jgi:predicted transcriptional regulator